MPQQSRTAYLMGTSCAGLFTFGIMTSFLGTTMQEWAARLPATEVVEVGRSLLWLLHDIAELDLDPVAAQFAVVICGHSHKPSIEWRDGVLYLNPGSAGPRRFRLPVTIARLCISRGAIRPQIVELDVRPFFTELALSQHLTPSRSQGLEAMIRAIRSKAAQLA